MKNTKKTNKDKNFIHVQLYQITINLTNTTKEHELPLTLVSGSSFLMTLKSYLVLMLSSFFIICYSQFLFLKS